MENSEIWITTAVAENVVLEIMNGLRRDKKTIPSRFFYDEKGTELFEEITRLPEYYLSRTEKSILRNAAPEITASCEYADVIELGSGDCSKISIILDAFSDEKIRTIRYIPVDISREAIAKSVVQLSEKYDGLSVKGIQADFLRHPLPEKTGRKKLVCFFGSTLGNMYPHQALDFLSKIKVNMNPGDEFLLGLDMVKDVNILNRAYNDRKGITAAFNRNILNSVNRYAGTRFDPDRFEHIAFFNPDASRIEMHLKASENMTVSGPHGDILFKKGETIHTENSYKYTLDDLRSFSYHTGLIIRNVYTDPLKWFSLVHFKQA